MKKLLVFSLTALILPLIFVPIVLGKIGVGVGTGKIEVNEKLKPGQIYNIPAVTVVNTGDEKSWYKVSITYHEKQPEIMPPAEWFSFVPEEVELEPGQAYPVGIKLNIPIKTVPGDYFAYIEASPIKKSEDGVTTISIAAASKLYFTVAPANFVEGVYYRVVSLWKLYTPWTNIAAMTIGVVILIFVFRKYFKIEINVKGKGNNINNVEKKNE